MVFRHIPLGKPGVYNQLENKAASLGKGIATAAAELGMGLQISRVASLLTVVFTSVPVIDYGSAKQANTEVFSKFFHVLLAEGIYWPPSQFEASFVSFAHSDEDIQFTIKGIAKSLGSI